MSAGARLKYKIVASFAIALAAIIGIVRLVAEAGVSAQATSAYVIFVIFAVAGVWRGVIYLRLARSGWRS